MTVTEVDRGAVATRWVEAVNQGDVGAMDELVAYDVVDHSGLNDGLGHGCEGHKQLVTNLWNSFPDWTGKVDSVEVNGDLVIVRHSGSATVSGQLAGLGGSVAADKGRIDFSMKTCVRVDDNGKIVEHWAMEGPFGQKNAPSYPSSGGAGGGSSPATGLSEANKLFMQAYVRNVIDGMEAGRARDYMVENFYNHDPAPGEEAGVEGAVKFISSIFSAFSGFQTTIEEQLAEDDLVVGRWSQQFVNTGPYLNFPASGREIHIGGITITRVRDQQIHEEWEARDALALLGQMGVPLPLGPLEGSTGASELGEAQKALVRRFFYDAWNRGQDSIIDELFAEDFTEHSPLPGQRPGTAGVKQLLQALHLGFPDSSVSADLQIADGDRVATRYTFRGTHLGRFRSIPATGKSVNLTGISIHRVHEGKITDHWGFFDDASLVFQLGLVQFPTPGVDPSGQPSPYGQSPPSSTPTSDSSWGRSVADGPEPRAGITTSSPWG